MESKSILFNEIEIYHQSSKHKDVYKYRVNKSIYILPETFCFR
jgi:hypothetical protein